MLRLVRPLRSGGMSELWVADHKTLSTHVVVKFLSPDLLQDVVSVARFEREAAAAAQVRSPHVVQYFDYGVSEHGPFLVMELLEGEDLSQRLSRGPMSLEDVAQIVVQISRALHKAHGKNIVHRDIKPDNIFLIEVGGNDIFCKLIDFGVAKTRATLVGTMHKTATGSLLGTPYYMSPEQAVNAKDIDHRTDLWSLGMVVFEAMTGRRALDVDGLGALVLALHTAPLPAPSTFDPALPQAVDEWFARACAKEPDERFGSAREMAEAFLRAIDGRGRGSLIVGTPVPAPAVVPRLHSPSAPTQVAPPPPAPSSSHETPPKVPSLRPPPPPASAPPQHASGDDWRQLIDRSNAVAPTALAVPPPRRSAQSSKPEIEPRPERPRLVSWILLAALAVLLFTGLSLALRGREALQVLLPGLYPSSSAAGKP